MAPVYRDHQHALLQRLEEALARAADLDALLTPTFWRVLPEAQRRSLLTLRAAAHAEGRAAAERLESAAQYVERLDRALCDGQARSRSEEHLPQHCPRPVPEAPTFPIGDLFGTPRRRDSAAVALLRARVGSICRRLDERATLDDFGTRGVLAALVVERAPFALTATLGRVGWSATGVAEVALRLRTSVGPRAGLLSLSPRGDAQHWLSFVMRRRSSLTGDDVFDGWFEVDAEAGAARVMLAPEVRAALCAVARDDAPTLRVADGVAELRWRFEPSHGTVRAAVEALRGLREAPPMALLREPSRRDAPR